MSTAPNQIHVFHWNTCTQASRLLTIQLKSKSSHILHYECKKYQSTLYRKVLLTFVRSQTHSMLHTNTGNMYINQCVCMYALPSHRQLRPTVQYNNISWSSSPFKCHVRAIVQSIGRGRCRCGFPGSVAEQVVSSRGSPSLLTSRPWGGGQGEERGSSIQGDFRNGP